MARKLAIKIPKYDRHTILFILMVLFDHLIGYLSYENRYFITGNLHPVYILGVLYIAQIEKRNLIRIMGLYLFLILFSVIQIFISPNGFSLPDCIINITKIVICFLVMYRFMKKDGDIDYAKAIKTVTTTSLMLFLVSLVWRTPYLWRLEDTVNRFDYERLKLLYNEPSEVGLHLGLIIIIAYGLYLDNRISLKRLAYVIIVNSLIVFFAKPLIGMAVIAMSIIIVTLIYILKHFSIKKLVLFFALIVVIAWMMWFLLTSDLSIAQRVRAVFSGEDASSYYRVILSWRILRDTIVSHWGFGVGFSRITSDYYLSKYAFWGLESIGITASYLNILIEGGIFGMILICSVISKMVVRIKNNFCYAKLGMLCFIVLYQTMGTYFTNPFCWMIYGLVLFAPENDMK